MTYSRSQEPSWMKPTSQILWAVYGFALAFLMIMPGGGA